MNVSIMQNEKDQQAFFKFSYKMELSLMDLKYLTYYIVVLKNILHFCLLCYNKKLLQLYKNRSRK